MKLPDWIPQVHRPWNRAYLETWEAMSTEERQWSFLFDLFMVALVVIVIYVLGSL